MEDVDYEKIAHFLFGLLDNIDTAEDMAKENLTLYQNLVHREHRRRFEVADTDGYIVHFTKTPETDGSWDLDAMAFNASTGEQETPND